MDMYIYIHIYRYRYNEGGREQASEAECLEALALHRRNTPVAAPRVRSYMRRFFFCREESQHCLH